MPHTQVPRIELSAAGDRISLTVEIYGFELATPVEITGSATQASGAVATFYSVQSMPAINDEGSATLTVIAVPSKEFKEGDPITVVARAAEVWVTNLVPDDSPLTTTGSYQPIKAAWKEADYRSAVSPG